VVQSRSCEGESPATIDAAPDLEESPRIKSRQVLRSRAKRALPLLVVLSASVVLGSLYEARHPMLSPIDELQHIDYAQRASTGDFVRRGDLIREPAMRAEACRGIAVRDFQPPPCTAPTLHPEDFQNEGQNTAYLDPPLYYLVTGAAARALEAVTPKGDFVTWSRLLGTAWLALALLAIWAAFEHLGITGSRRTLPLLIVITSPIVLFTQATVTSDAVLMTSGSALLWAVLGWERRRCPAWIAIVIVILGTLGKLNVAVAALASGVYLLVRCLDGSRERTRAEYIRLATSLVGTAGFVSFAWILIVSQRALVPAEAIVLTDLFRVSRLTLGDLMSAASATLSPVQNPPLGAAFEPRTTFSFVSLHHVLLVFPALTYMFVRPKRDALRATAIATMSSAISLGPAVVIWTYTTQGLYFPTPPRYSLALLPAMALLLGALTETRLGAVALFAVGASSYLYFISRLV
jgi:hypothetical protein